MNKRIQEIAEQARKYARDYVADCKHYGYCMEYNEYELQFEEKFAELIALECAKELREAEQEADRAYKAKEVKERNTFDGYGFADMLEERFGVEE